jgi:soluble lytic murein transglycosylase-like protein
MSVEQIGARIAAIQSQIATVTGQVQTTAATGAPSFASQLATAQSGTSATTTAGAGGSVSTTLGGGTPSAYDAQITAAATKHGLDPALLKGLIRQESNFNPNARSGAGATGLTQLMPGTAAGLGVTDATDPAQAIDGGAKYLKAQLDRFGGDASKALAAYNAGPGAVAKYGGVPPYAETQNYVTKVLGYAAEYRGAGAATTPATTAAAPLATAPVSLPASPSGSLDYSTV